MEHQHQRHQREHERNGALSAAENQLLALIAMIAIEQVIAETSQNSRTEQSGAAA